MFNFKNNFTLISIVVFALLTGCAPSAETLQDKEEFNTSLIELMEEMSTSISKDQQIKKERLVLKYTNKSSEIQLELDPNEDEFYLDLSGLSPAGKDTIFIREPTLNPNQENKEGKETGKDNEPIEDDGDNEDDIRLVLAKFRKAQDLFYLEEYSEALKLLNETLEVAETADAYALKGTIHFMLGNRNATRENWNRAVELNPNLPMPTNPELEEMVEEIMAEE